jgi:hypothetical protein
MSQAIDEAREGLELVRTALGKRAFHVTEPHLSGHRVCIGFENRDDAFALHYAITKLEQQP